MDKYLQHEQGQYKPVDWQRPKPDDNWPYHNHPNNGNDRQYGIKSPKFERHIFIRRDQILYDINAQLGMLAATRKKDDGTEDDTLAQATEKFAPMFYRWIDTHLGIAKQVMSAFVLEKFKDTSMNSIKDKEEVDVTLLMPEWYDDTTFPQLTNAVHNYIVNGTLHDYLVLTLTSKDPVTVDKEALAVDSLHEVKKLINAAKPGRISKTQKPF